MGNAKLIIAAIIIGAIGIIASMSLFTVHQTQQALILQFGNPVRVVTDPGLNFKLPFVQSVEFYEKRVLNLDPPVQEVILADKKRINVDAFARYNIVDVLEFRKTVRDEIGLRSRFSGIINSAMREVMGRLDLTDLLSEKRDDVMKTINEQVNQEGARYGIKILDVRIGRTELPEEISRNVYDRMRTERQREANKLRAEGEEIAATIRAEADRQRTVIVAEAERESAITRGQGDAEKERILRNAYQSDPEFFSFYRSMEAYRKALADGNTSLVLSPDSQFFKYFEGSTLKAPN
ncbi:protease modulator HflC [Alphaproteobacteria bacterium HT1-32]|nr:protease modulator HflC [Alphaproteobacteria bacterium HT1-32]